MNSALLAQAADTVRRHWPEVRPAAVLVCGSGWSSVLERFDCLDALPFHAIPGLGSPGVVGHSGQLARCRRGATELLVFQGRRHFYEGDGWTPVAIPPYLCKALQAPILLLTNSAGCIRTDWEPGDLMCISDHLNFLGDTPLVGTHDPFWGPRFPDQSRVYDPDLQRALHAAAETAGVPLRTGVYLAARGPAYETPAEIRAFRGLGADAVGMSTVPEAMLGAAAGLRVAGLSCMTNFAAGIVDQPLTHEEVTETTATTMPRMQALLTAWVDGLG